MYENEIKDVEELFFLYNKYQILKGRSNFPLKYSDEINNKFKEIIKKRYINNPALYVTAPLSRVAKILFAPRISSFFKDTSGFNASKSKFLFFTIYNFVYVFPSIILCLVGIIFIKKFMYDKIFIYCISFIIGHIYVYTSWVPLTQSRYLIPLFNIFIISCDFFINSFQI